MLTIAVRLRAIGCVNFLEKVLDICIGLVYYNYRNKRYTDKHRKEDIIMTVRNLVFMNDDWNTDTELTFFDNNEVQFMTVDVETLLQFYPNILESKVQHFGGLNIYLK